MSLSRTLRPLLAAALACAATAAPAWVAAPAPGVPRAWIDVGIGTPVIHRHGYHYGYLHGNPWVLPGYVVVPPPHWPAYHGWYAPPPRHWRHHPRHSPRGWAGRHPARGPHWRR